MVDNKQTYSFDEYPDDDLQEFFDLFFDGDEPIDMRGDSTRPKMAHSRRLGDSDRPDLYIDVDDEQTRRQMSNSISTTDKSAEDVILAAKRAHGYKPPEHKTKKRKKKIREHGKGNPGKHLR